MIVVARAFLDKKYSLTLHRWTFVLLLRLLFYDHDMHCSTHRAAPSFLPETLVFLRKYRAPHDVMSFRKQKHASLPL